MLQPQELLVKPCPRCFKDQQQWIITNLRKEKQFLVTDKIIISVEKNEKIESAFQNNLNYICNETLSEKLVFSSRIENHEKINLIDEISCNVLIEKQQ